MIRDLEKESSNSNLGDTEAKKARISRIAQELERLRQALGKECIHIIEDGENGEIRGEAILELIDPYFDEEEQVYASSRLREARRSLLSREERKNHPEYQKHQKLSKEEKFYHQPLPDAESDFHVYKRVKNLVTGWLVGLKRNGDDALPVFVTHRTTINHFGQGIKVTQEGTVPDSFAKGAKRGEIFVVKVKGSQTTGYTFEGIERRNVLTTS